MTPSPASRVFGNVAEVVDAPVLETGLTWCGFESRRSHWRTARLSHAKDDFMSKPGITAEFLWRQHRAALGGKSAITGAALPVTLHECNAGVQGSHYGMAAAVNRMLGLDEPPLPPLVTPDRAEEIRRSLSICVAG